MRPRKAIAAVFILGLLAGPVTAAQDNDFYDEGPFVDLPLRPIEVVGEVAAPGPIDFSGLPLRTVSVREAVTRAGGPEFVGAYTYRGYSLFDILRNVALAKRNEKEFRPVVDLLVVVENAKGEKAVFSWGEIFYPTTLHRSLVAVQAAAIVPSLTKDRWPLPGKARLVGADDHLSERNLEDPVRITVRSGPLSFPVSKGGPAPRAPSVRVVDGGREAGRIERLAADVPLVTFPSVFYGRGRGFHEIADFSGAPLRSVLKGLVPTGPAALREGYLILAAEDGYRAVFSASEVFNRNDNADVLLRDRGEAEGGRFSIFPGPDFFSDRAVKALKEIHCLAVD